MLSSFLERKRAKWEIKREERGGRVGGEIDKRGGEKRVAFLLAEETGARMEKTGAGCLFFPCLFVVELGE